MKAIGKRLYDLLIKLISLKVVAACIVSYVALRIGDSGAIFIVGFMWSLVIGTRTLEKYIAAIGGKTPAAPSGEGQ